MDVHRSFAQVAILADGNVVEENRLDLVHSKVLAFGCALNPDDEIVLEATGNTAVIERLLRPFVGRVVIANSRMVRAIAYARVKTDKIDASLWLAFTLRVFFQRSGQPMTTPSNVADRPRSV